LAATVRKCREDAGVSQERLAARAGVSLSWLSKLERGEIIEPGLFPILALLRELRVQPTFAVLWPHAATREKSASMPSSK
jgi:transcriptional regulator with XRE-family HTH domain